MNNQSTQKSALGMEGNITALLGYIIGIIALILVFIEKENRFVRFHALQSVFWAVATIVLAIGVMIVGGILSVIVGQVSSNLGGLMFLVTMLLYGLVFVGFFGGLIFAAIKSYQGQMFKLPLVGSFAEKFA